MTDANALAPGTEAPFLILASALDIRLRLPHQKS
jgi:hypothetical protein